MCSWWSAEPYVVLKQVENTGVVYRVRPEKGGKVLTLHRNALKVCLAPRANTSPPPVERAAETLGFPGAVFFGFFPTTEPTPSQQNDSGMALRCSTRTRRGYAPARYSETEP